MGAFLKIKEEDISDRDSDAPASLPTIGREIIKDREGYYQPKIYQYSNKLAYIRIKGWCILLGASASGYAVFECNYIDDLLQRNKNPRHLSVVCISYA